MQFLEHTTLKVNNETALNFYKKYGFEQKGVAEKYYKRIEPDNAYILVKHIDRSVVFAMVYKVTYFDIRGFGEYIRLLLTDQGVEFIDDRIEREKWPEMKSRFAFNQVPCLTENDVPIVQTGAIMRHLGRKFNLNGSTESEETFIDMFFEGVRDLRTKYSKMIYTEYENKDDFIKNVYPVELAKLEKLLKTHKNGEQYVAGDKVSYADYILFEELDVALILDPHSLDKFSALKAFHERWSSRPSLKNYLDRRNLQKVDVNYNGKQ
uniref:glutathione transferase n=1 Tax=Heterorhabditis bacteriophora TaxID=37862 RepID=A0A1I7XV95_HETBA